MESKINDIKQKYLKLEMNVEKELIQISDVFYHRADDFKSRETTDEFIDLLTYIMNSIEENQKMFTKLIPPNKCPVGRPLTNVENMKDYISFFINAIRQNILWKYANIQFGECTKNAFFCVWKTICFALFDNPFFIDQLYDTDFEYYPSFLGDVMDNSTNMKTAVIVLDDADLDSVVSFLTSITNKPCVWEVSKIYVQEAIEKKFIHLYKERSKNSVDVELILTVFRFKEELPSKIENHTDAISIWTENVSAAKCFVMSMMVPLTWINSYGEFGPGISLRTNLKLPSLSGKSSSGQFKVISNPFQGSGTKFDLFYDGSWKKPKSGKYYVTNEISWASTSQADIESCVQSAKKGFDKWRCVPLSQRKVFLQRFANRILATGNTSLADLIKSQLENPTLFGSMTTIIRDGTVEVLTVRDPKGVVLIREKDINHIFLRLINACIAGNSIIVVHYATFCSIAGYCDMLTTSGIPPGVINLLSFENLVNGWREVYNSPHVYRGCCPCFTEEEDDCLMEIEWLDQNTLNQDSQLNEKMYLKYTQPKSIWIPLK